MSVKKVRYELQFAKWFIMSIYSIRQYNIPHIIGSFRLRRESLDKPLGLNEQTMPFQLESGLGLFSVFKYTIVDL